jgi:hypothetical protein
LVVGSVGNWAGVFDGVPEARQVIAFGRGEKVLAGLLPKPDEGAQ